MPTSTISLRAQELASTICECLTALDLADCECFHGNNSDWCCNVTYGWASGTDLNCSGIFVNFVGTDVDYDRAPCGPQRQVAEYQVGFALCPPDVGTSTTKYATQYRDYTECLEYMSEEVWKCLSALTCCNDPNAGDIVEVSGIEPDNDGRFVLSVRVVV